VSLISKVYTHPPFNSPEEKKRIRQRMRASKRRKGMAWMDRQAETFRGRMTPPELILWRKLKTLRIIQVRFQPQVVLLQKYIADFYLEPKRIVVEVDGSCHLEATRTVKDAQRDADMQAAGITVLRFPASRVFSDADSVLREITEPISTNAISDQQNAAEPEACGRRTPSREVRGVTEA